MLAEGRRGVAIVTAMGIESAGLSRALQVGPWDRRSPHGWHEGLLAGCPAVLATCGIGVRSAHRWAQVLLDEYEPRLVILTGAGGGVAPHVDVGDLVLGDAIYHLEQRRVLSRHDVDPGLLTLAHQAAAAASLRRVRSRDPRVVQGAVGTTGRAVGDRAWGARLAREHGILAVEMEGAAIAQACSQRGVPFLVLRAVSDVIGCPWQWLTMIRYLVPAQRNAERLIFALVQRLASLP